MNSDTAILASCIEIGVALTSFGGLFMLLGVMLFFDGALLALGNVRPVCYTFQTSRSHMNSISRDLSNPYRSSS